MPLLPKNWRVHEGRDPEKELQKIQRRFEAIRRRADRRDRILKMLRENRMQLLGASLVFAITFVVFFFSPFSPWDTMRHIAAAPNCAFARFVELAPARRGDAGYWAHHDGDDDGIACEPLWRSRNPTLALGREADGVACGGAAEARRGTRLVESARTLTDASAYAALRLRRPRTASSGTRPRPKLLAKAERMRA
jgi:hypothetical protein